MKKLMITCTLLIAILTNVNAQSEKDVYLFAYFKDNGADGLHLAYSNDAYNWTALKNDRSFLTPTVSNDKLMRDPCILKGADGIFHMVWTVSWKSNGIGYASSKDLINWSTQEFLPVMEHQEGVENSWAPEITFDSKTNLYMIYWSSTIKGKFVETLLKTEEGNNNNRIYYVTTKDFKSFSATKLLYEPGFNVIDASIVNNKGKFVMFLKDETRQPVQKNIKIAYADRLTGPYSKASEPITGNYWAEGPTSLMIGKEWVVYFDKYTAHKYGAIKSTDLKTWIDVSDKISIPKGLRHGTILKIQQSELKKLLANER